MTDFVHLELVDKLLALDIAKNGGLDKIRKRPVVALRQLAETAVKPVVQLESALSSAKASFRPASAVARASAAQI